MIKTNSSGDTVWTRVYGREGLAPGEFIKQTSDSGYIILGLDNSETNHWRVYLIKTNSSGDTIWTKAYGSKGIDWGSSVQQTADGGYMIAGGTGGWDIDRSTDLYVIRTDTFGDTLWTRTYAGPNGAGAQFARSVQPTVDGGYIIAGTTYFFHLGEFSAFYLIKTLASSTVSVRESRTDGTPTTFGLEQNYPNPFNPSTRIGFRVPIREFVSLKVHGMLGQELATLVNGKLNPGNYEVTWDATGMTTGVYLYRFTAGTFSESKRMVLLK